MQEGLVRRIDFIGQKLEMKTHKGSVLTGSVFIVSVVGDSQLINATKFFVLTGVIKEGNNPE